MGLAFQSGAFAIVGLGNFLVGIFLGSQRATPQSRQNDGCSESDRCLARLEGSARFNLVLEVAGLLGWVVAAVLGVRRLRACLRCRPCARRPSEVASRAEVSAPARRRIEASLSPPRSSQESVGASSTGEALDSGPPAPPATYVPRRLRAKTTLA